MVEETEKEVMEMGLVRGFGRDKRRIKKPAGDNELAGPVKIIPAYKVKKEKSNNLTKRRN